MKSKKFGIENTNIKCSEAEFDSEVERNMDLMSEFIPVTDPNYESRLVKSAISCALAELDPTSEYNSLVEYNKQDIFIDSEC